MTDRGFWVAGFGVGGNVRRLMYQALIWAAMLRDEARRLGAALNAQNVQRLANALVDSVRGNAELGGDLLRIEMLADQPKAIELSGGQAGDALGNRVGFGLMAR